MFKGDTIKNDFTIKADHRTFYRAEFITPRAEMRNHQAALTAVLSGWPVFLLLGTTIKVYVSHSPPPTVHVIIKPNPSKFSQALHREPQPLVFVLVGYSSVHQCTSFCRTSEFQTTFLGCLHSGEEKYI